jgi:hypothetical protein
MNHVLHLMLMGLGRVGSISIAYQFYFPVYRSTARSVGDVGAVARAGASMPGRTMHTVCSMASLPFPFSIPAHDTVSKWSWIFRRKSSDRQIGDRNEKRESRRYYHLRKDRCALVVS